MAGTLHADVPQVLSYTSMVGCLGQAFAGSVAIWELGLVLGGLDM